jgi:hypothetical protein
MAQVAIGLFEKPLKNMTPRGLLWLSIVIRLCELGKLGAFL